MCGIVAPPTYYRDKARARVIVRTEYGSQESGGTARGMHWRDGGTVLGLRIDCVGGVCACRE